MMHLTNPRHTSPSPSLTICRSIKKIQLQAKQEVKAKHQTKIYTIGYLRVYHICHFNLTKCQKVRPVKVCFLKSEIKNILSVSVLMLIYFVWRNDWTSLINHN